MGRLSCLKILACQGKFEWQIVYQSPKKTKLGWVASVGHSIVRDEYSSLAALRKVLNFEEDSLSEIVKRFWEIDNSCG